MKVLSLYDGMSCGAIALKQAKLPIDSYDAFEIDEPAIKTAIHNFPLIKQHGDVFEGEFTQFEGVDLLCGGSPCTHWSIAQTKNRETQASGLGWELFSQYVRALKEAKPKYFIYENNASMSEAIQISISNTFGFDPVCINSALVSAQSRNRLYWIGKRETDGTYSKVDIVQPTDRGILLKDILDGAMDLTSNDKSWTLTASYDGACAWNTIERNQRNMCVEPVKLKNQPIGETEDAKSYCLTAGYANGSGEKIGNYVAHTLQKGCKSMVAEPVNIAADGKSHTLKAQYYKNGMANFITNGGFCSSAVAELVGDSPNQVGSMPKPNGELSTSQGFRIYDVNAKTVTLKGNAGGAGGKTGLYAIPIEFEDNIPTKAISQSDGKTYTVHTVTNGMITIRDKEYPIKLADGYYIIRKLSIDECKRLQTVPEWYEFPVSNAQAYKMLGNGWTVDVIVHILKCIFDSEYKKNIATTIKSSQKRLF